MFKVGDRVRWKKDGSYVFVSEIIYKIAERENTYVVECESGWRVHENLNTVLNYAGLKNILNKNKRYWFLGWDDGVILGPDTNFLILERVG